MRRRPTTRVGLVGCGAIGTAIAQALERDYPKVARIVALVDQSRAHARILQRQLARRPPLVSLPELIRRSDLVIEAASLSVAPHVVRLALASHRDVLVMSTGGLLAQASAVARWARRSRGHVHVPSGGLCGLDGLKAMAVGKLHRIELTTRKPPAALVTSPFVTSRRLSLNHLTRPRVLFEGSPAQAVNAFPQNVNVAATMTLACLLGGRTRRASTKMVVRVVADPTIRRNIHELSVEGDSGRLHCRIESRPSHSNPKTSEMAIQSAIATLRQLFDPVSIGT